MSADGRAKGAELAGSPAAAAFPAAAFEEALRAAAALSCAQVGWRAARIELLPAAGEPARTVWHLAQVDQLGSLQRSAEARRSGQSAAATQPTLGDPTFSIAFRAAGGSAVVDFFGALPPRPAAELLAVLAQSCASLGELLGRPLAADSFQAEREDRELFAEAGEELRTSAERDRQLFEKSPQPMWVVDAQTQRLLAVNDAALRAYGYSRREMLAMRVNDLREPDAEATAPAEHELSFGAPWAADVQRHRTASGEVRDVEVAAHEMVHQGLRARLFAITDVTRRRLLQARLLHAAFYDALTGLPNRALFKERLEVAHARARREGARFAVLFLDLDRFKLVNDSLGHEAGDNLLVQIARRLESCRRKSDIVARLGGDEFTVLVEGAEDEAAAVQVAERLHRALAQPFQVRGHEVFARMSIGIALGGPGRGRPEILLREADTAMYRAKLHGGRHAVYDGSMQEHALASLTLENDLRRALERGELRVYYQPVVQLATGRTAGVEALVRWQHPTRGLLLPADFLPMAEETGLILELGRWVLGEACKKARALPDEVTLSVNLSGHQLLQPDLVDQVKAALASSGFPAQRLLLELTESTLIETGPAGAARMDELRALGGGICLDDFGTGYSSLSYLHALPIDALKIDASFVRALASDRRKVAIVESILMLGKGLDIDVVAEGIETKEQADLMTQLGCHQAQGFLYSRAVPMETLLG